MVGDDVDEQPHVVGLQLVQQGVEPGPAAQLGIHPGRVGHVVAVGAPRHRGQDRRDVEHLDTEGVEVRDQPACPANPSPLSCSR